MEIHAPVSPLSSWREILLHLGIVTIGILIALGLESIVEWRHHVALAREARENILSEIRDNRRELQAILSASPKIIGDQRQVVQLANDLLAKHTSAIHRVGLSFHRADLSKTSWITAESVGAISFMPYQEVKSYANIYELQDEYVRLEERSIDAGMAALTFFADEQDPFKLPDAQLRSLKSATLASISDVTTETQFGEELVKRYSKVLDAPR